MFPKNNFSVKRVYTDDVFSKHYFSVKQFFQPVCCFFFSLLRLVVCVFSLSSCRLIVLFIYFFAGYLQLYLEISWLILYRKFFLFEFNISHRIFPVANQSWRLLTLKLLLCLFMILLCQNFYLRRECLDCCLRFPTPL